MATRSVVLAVGTINGADVLAWTTPADHTVILKTINVSSFDPGVAFTVRPYLIRAGRPPVYLQPLSSVAGQGVAYVELWVVLEQGDQLALYSTADPLEYWLSGADLPSPSA